MRLSGSYINLGQNKSVKLKLIQRAKPRRTEELTPSTDMGAASINADKVVLIPTATGGVASWTKSIGIDRAGDDIACYTDGTTVDKCASLCAVHKNCKAYNAVDSSMGGVWSKGGCCLKTVNGPTGPNPLVNFYTGNR